MTRQDLFDAIAQVSDLPDTQALDAIVEFARRWMASQPAHWSPQEIAARWEEDMA